MGVTWLPRIGLAYQILPKTVLRAGYGIFYGSIGSFKTSANLTGFSQSTPIEATNDNGLTFKATLADPLPTGLLAPLGAAGGMTTALNSNINYFATDRVQPYAQRWSLGLQQELKGGFVAEASYVGNRGTRLGVSRNINATPLQYLSTAPLRDQATITYLGASFPSPFYGLDPLYTSTTISREQMLRPYPHFGSITYQDPVGYSWFHSMQSRIEKRMAHGFTLQVSYTWSKAMEATSFLNGADAMPYESLGDIDRAHRIVGSGIWELPVGKGRKFGAQMPKLLEFFAGGWQLSGVMQRQSGQPIGWGQMIIVGDSTKIALPSDRAQCRPLVQYGRIQQEQRCTARVQRPDVPPAFLEYPAGFAAPLGLLVEQDVPDQRARQGAVPRGYVQRLERARIARSEYDVTSSAFGQITAQEPPRSFQFSAADGVLISIDPHLPSQLEDFDGYRPACLLGGSRPSFLKEQPIS